jgi:hypothetical protein
MPNQRKERNVKLLEEEGGGVPVPAAIPEAEVIAKPTRRFFTAKYKLAILKEADGASEGEIGKMLRREGLYSSHLTTWRRARDQGVLDRLSAKRGPKPVPPNPLVKKVDQLEREIGRLREKLRKAELILDVQGKVAGLLGLNLGGEQN